MVGTIIMIVILLVAPVLILLGSSVFAAVFGALLNRDVDQSYEGTELLTLAETGKSIAD